MKKYFPILLSKAGELTALSQLQPNVKAEISPTIQILADNVGAVQAHINSHWSFQDNQILLDLSLFEPYDNNVISQLFTSLLNNGINVVPVIQANSNVRYISLVRRLVSTHNCNVCIRASNESGGFGNYNTLVADLMGKVSVSINNTLLLIDLGYAQQNTYNNLSSLAILLIRSIPNLASWSKIIVAASSFPENLAQLVPAGRLYRLPRYEWNIWSAIQANRDLASVVDYGDYGTKYPFYSEANFQGTCSIKYTAQSDFVIYRGELSGNHPDGNGQYIAFANRLIHTADYPGTTFCWGDERVNFYAHQVITNPRRQTGNAKTWVEISQNHHITLLHSLL